MTRVIANSVRVLFVLSFLTMLAADWLLLGTGLSFAADTIGFFGFVTLGLLTAFSFRRNWYRLGAIVLLTALAFGWIGIESHSERLGYRLFVARHRGALESTAQHPDSIRDLDSMLGTINVHAQISSNDAAAFMIDNDDFNSQGCLIYAPDSAPSYETLYRLGLHWITVEPRHLTGNWYYCEEAVE